MLFLSQSSAIASPPRIAEREVLALHAAALAVDLHGSVTLT
jgi:hypothetical protein